MKIKMSATNLKIYSARPPSNNGNLLFFEIPSELSKKKSNPKKHI